MNNSMSKMFSDILGKMDEKMLQTKLNAALDMLKKGDTDELAKKLNKMDKKELLKKINEIDASKLQELNINKEEIKQKLSETDLDGMAKIIGEHGEEIVNKIKDIIG